LSLFSKRKKAISSQKQSELIITINKQPTVNKPKVPTSQPLSKAAKNTIVVQIDSNGIWTCPYCDTFNKSTVIKCAACGGNIKQYK